MIVWFQSPSPPRRGCALAGLWGMGVPNTFQSPSPPRRGCAQPFYVIPLRRFVVSIPIPSEKGMRHHSRWFHNPIRNKVSIPIPSEKGMRQRLLDIRRRMNNVSIPIPSEKGMRPGCVIGNERFTYVFQSPSPPRRGCAASGDFAGAHA